MKRIFLSALLAISLCLGMIPINNVVWAAPDSINAPEHFGVKHYNGDYFVFTMSAPDDLRAIINDYNPVPVVKCQIDYKLGNGDWHYEASWDEAKYTLKNTVGFSFKRGECYISGGRSSISSMFPEDAAALQTVKDSGWNIPPVALSFRVRFVTSLDGNKTFLYSSWSDTFVYSKAATGDPDALISHAPILTSATVEKNSGGMPFLKIMTGRLPGECQDLNAIVGGGMKTEVWMRKAGQTEFKLINNASFFQNEYILIGVSDYFDQTQKSYDSEAYEVKIRYVLNDLRSYPQAGRSDIIYSPFSNLFSQSMPAWSGASAWASAELQKADDAGLIPDILQGANMTKPITREEFAALALKLYEKVTGRTAPSSSSNPFTDTSNPEVVKAYQLGITTGTSDTTFDPKNLTNREQVATMLSRAMRIMAPDNDFSTTGAPEFTDSSDISSWALEHVKFMSKAGIIKGTNGKFMPRATTAAQEASGYAATTREQALAMSVRIYERNR